MSRSLAGIGLITLATLALAASTAAARVTRIGTITSGSALVAAADGTYAYASSPDRLTYGNANTGMKATSPLSDGCNPTAASTATVLITCALDPLTLQGPPPMLLDTRTGLTSTPPNPQLRPGDTFSVVGAAWIRGTRPDLNGKVPSGVYVNRQTGETRVTTPIGSYDLDDPQLQARPVPRRAGTSTLAFDNTTTVRTTFPKNRLQIVQKGRVRTIGRAATASLSSTSVAWAEGNRIRRYLRKSGRIITTTFSRSPSGVRVVALDRGILVATPARRGGPPTRIYRITT